MLVYFLKRMFSYKKKKLIKSVIICTFYFVVYLIGYNYKLDFSKIKLISFLIHLELSPNPKMRKFHIKYIRFLK